MWRNAVHLGTGDDDDAAAAAAHGESKQVINHMMAEEGRCWWWDNLRYLQLRDKTMTEKPFHTNLI
jgi:hypothetical protein